MQHLIRTWEEFEFYSKFSGKLLRGFKEESGMIYQISVEKYSDYHVKICKNAKERDKLENYSNNPGRSCWWLELSSRGARENKGLKIYYKNSKINSPITLMGAGRRSGWHRFLPVHTHSLNHHPSAFRLHKRECGKAIILDIQIEYFPIIN